MGKRITKYHICYIKEKYVKYIYTLPALTDATVLPLYHTCSQRLAKMRKVERICIDNLNAKIDAEAAVAQSKQNTSPSPGSIASPQSQTSHASVQPAAQSSQKRPNKLTREKLRQQLQHVKSLIETCNDYHRVSSTESSFTW